MKKIVLLFAVAAMCASTTVIAQDNQKSCSKSKTEECQKKEGEKKCDKDKDSKSCCKKTSENKSCGKK